MAETNLGAVTQQIQTFWSPLFMEALNQTNILMNLCNRDYDGDIKQGGDTVKVSQINTPVGEVLTIDGVGGARTFTPETMVTQSVSIKADKRLVASFDFEDLIAIQSLIDPMGAKSVEIRNAMVQAISNQLNAYLYSLVAPTPVVGFTYSTATLSAAIVADQRQKAATNKWTQTKPWYALLDPAYFTDLLLDTTFANADFGAEDRPTIGGNFGLRRYNFNLFEDNTGAQAAQTPDTNGLFFHPDFLYLVTQLEPRFKISDKHAQGEFAAVMSVDMIVGAELGIEGPLKHFVVTTEAPI